MINIVFYLRVKLYVHAIVHQRNFDFIIAAPDDKEKNETKEDDKKEFEITDFQEEKKYNEFIAYMEKTSKINQKVSLQVRRHWMRILWNGFSNNSPLTFYSAFWMMSMFLSYIITVMLWWILGSVLSRKILPVTSSTITFVTYCIATSKKLWNSRKSVKLKILEVIDKKIDQKLKKLLENLMITSSYFWIW